MSKSITIKDVARRAGVSVGTVSKVINSSGYLSDASKKKVKDAIEALGYIPNQNARILKREKSTVIGIILSSLNGLFFHNLIDEIYRYIELQGYTLDIFIASQYTSYQSCMHILSTRPAGVIILGEILEPKEIDLLKKYEIYTVFLDKEVASKSVSSVILDNTSIELHNALKLLTEGRTNIVFMGGFEHNYDTIKRYEGLTQYLGYHVPKIWGEFSEKGGYESMKNYLQDHRPDAIFCANDKMARGVAQACHESMLSIPKDVRILGFDNDSSATASNPHISTIEVPFTLWGQWAIKELFTLIREEREGIIQKVPVSFISRESL